MEKELTKIQRTIIERMSEVSNIFTPHIMYFYGPGGFFLNMDTLVPYDDVKGLIDLGIIVYKGIGKHQGEKMMMYTLA